MKKPAARLLVVDDSRSTRAALSRFLEKAGHAVTVVASGEEALDVLGRETFDLVLLDVVMKGMSGLEVLTQIRQKHTKLELPVLMATARADSSDVIRALELGANDMLRGLAPSAMRHNLDEIVARTRRAHPQVRIVIAGMRAAPNLGPRYRAEFEAVYPALASESSAALIPDLLDGVAGEPSLNQPDGIHPTSEGHRRVADVVWGTLEPVAREAGSAGGG